MVRAAKSQTGKQPFLAKFTAITKIMLIMLLAISVASKMASAEISLVACANITAPETYVLNQNITSTGTCIRIMTDNVVLDCQGNTITYNTAGLSTNMGIDGSNGTQTRTNITIQNCVLVKPVANQTAGYGIRLSRYSNSRIINNTIYTNGTTNNYGIYLAAQSNNNTIENNTINSSGTNTGNHGIYVYNCSNNNLTQNTIYTRGTTTNYGIYILGTSSAEAANNIMLNNNIYTNGLTAGSNYGIYLYSNANHNMAMNNNITTNGATTNNFGVYILGTAALTADNNQIINNTIYTNGTSNNYGIALATNTNNNNITNNYIATSGLTGGNGVYVSGSSYESKGNIISYNTIIANGTNQTTSNNYGIYLYRRANNNFLVGNNITATGTASSYGIRMAGTTALPVNNNTVSDNTIITSGRIAGNNFGIYMTNYINQNNITRNTITTTGTTTNYGIYLAGAEGLQSDSNIITENTITATGTTTNNYGMVLSSNTNSNIISRNNISTQGTSGNIGVYLAGAATLPSNDNQIAENMIITQGSADNNFGVYVLTNANSNTVQENTIITDGTTTNHGVYVSGATFTSNNNNILYNSISARGSGVANYGVYLYRNVSWSNVTGNTISTTGTVRNYGIYLLGTAALTVSSNTLAYNSLQVTTSDVILINTGSKNTKLINNTILEKNPSYYELNVSSQENNGTQLIDQNFESYYLRGTGEKITIESPGYGEIAYSEKVTGAVSTSSIIISNNYAYVNSSQSGLNKSAVITLYNINYQYPTILMDGVVCTDCVILSNSGGTVVFSVPHFSSYAVSENSQLQLFDNSNENETHGSLIVYANYTNRTSGQPINGTGVNCTISINGAESENMSFSLDTWVYEITKEFGSDGEYTYVVNCNGTAQGFEAIQLSGSTNYYNELYGPRNNYKYYYTTTRANVTNARPEILNITCNDGQEIILAVGATQQMTCLVKMRDYNGGSTITSTNATLYYYMNSPSDPDDDNVHYTNNSCTVNDIDGYNTTWACSFDIWYYANNGTWMVNVTATDDFPYHVSKESSTTILPLYAINVTPLIDFGSLGVGDVSSNMEANVTNLGNMQINVSVYAFGGDNELTGAGLAMICQQRNITLDNERYSLDSSAVYDSMTAVTSSSSIIAGLTLSKQIESGLLQTNSTYWRLYVNETSNHHGVCNGTIIFSAESS